MSANSSYNQIIEWVFFNRFTAGDRSVPFDRSDIDAASDALNLPHIKNLGDVIYAFRYRRPLPSSVTELAEDGMEWVIRGIGRAKYAFELVKMVRIRPSENLITTKIPDATPEIINASALADEQALLALVRYNRLIDVFLGLTAYSLQNHLRTTAQGIGQVEIDEVYVAVDQFGQEYIIPVQAKGHSDEIGITQPEQDVAVCKEKWPNLVPLPVAVQFMDDKTIAMFLLAMQGKQLSVVRESHYKLVPYSDITVEDRRLYQSLSRIGRSSDSSDMAYALVDLDISATP